MMSWYLLDMTGEITDNLNSYVPMHPDRSNDELSETCGKLQEIQKKKQNPESDIEIHNPEDQMIKLRLKTRSIFL